MTRRPSKPSAHADSLRPLPVSANAQLSTSWDPLDDSNANGKTALATAARRAISNILKSYTGFFDPFCELIQNAMDAIDERRRQLNEKNYSPSILIEIDISEQSFTVVDNGIGFTEEQFRAFLAPHITFKNDGPTRGKKGVGATYLGYGFNHLDAGTKTPGYCVSASLHGGRNWIEESGAIKPPPKITAENRIPDRLSTIDRGSFFTLKFIGKNIRPTNLGWYKATNAEQWKSLLLLKTPLGHIAFEQKDKSHISVSIRVIDSTKQHSQLVCDAEYAFPDKVISGCKPVADILAVQQKLIDKQRDSSLQKLPDEFKRLNGVYHFWPNDKLVGLLSGNRNLEHANVLTKYKATAYGFFCYSVMVWDYYNDNIVKLRQGLRVLKGGLQLATDHMPQGELIVIPLTSNIGYQNQSHVVVHFIGADPDLGRKGFQPELKEAAEAASVAIVNYLKTFRPLLKKDAGAAPNLEAQSALHDWVRRQEQYEETNSLNIVNANFFAPINQLPITAKPKSEQDVIALFNQLLAGGVIRGIRLLATDQHSQYDGVFRYYYAQPADHHIYDVEKNPLGMQNLPRKDHQSRPFVLEYKYSLDGLWAEFEADEKQQGDINLVVAWDLGTGATSKYSVTCLLDHRNIQHRPFHGLTHVFRDESSGNVAFYGVILSELLDYLGDPNAFQAVVRKRYGEESL